MSLENKMTEAIKGKKGEAKREALLVALENFAEENIEEKRKQDFYDKREKARQIIEEIFSDFAEAKRQEFNNKWQGYENNDFTIEEIEVK